MKVRSISVFHSTIYVPMIGSNFSFVLLSKHPDLFAWVAADVHGNEIRLISVVYTSLLARLCVSGPELESQLPSKPEKSAESHSARNCLLKLLENFSRKDLMDLLLCYLANNPEVLKVLFVGVANSCETISKTKLQITFPKMINTIADEYMAEWVYKDSRFRFKSEPGLFHVFVNVSDMEKETLVVIIRGNLLMVTGKLTRAPIYGEKMKKGEKDMIRQLYKKISVQQAIGDVVARTRLYYEEYDLKQATCEIIESGELRISYPEVHEEVERPSCMQVKLNQIYD
ncbi:hypothetical protein Hdeb2414_s0010g00339531 [Helianthus debilis subsp. tardiflorus]